MKDRKTRADPVSFCNRMMKAGVRIMPKAMSHMLRFSTIVLPSLKNLAKVMAVASFMNSVGCMLKLPILIQEVAPLILEPRKKVEITSSMQNRYR